MKRLLLVFGLAAVPIASLAQGVPTIAAVQAQVDRESGPHPAERSIVDRIRYSSGYAAYHWHQSRVDGWAIMQHTKAGWVSLPMCGTLGSKLPMQALASCHVPSPVARKIADE